jgi:alpha-D-ribose 1-methylphosphonate 5-triphosphate diphosphatase
VTEIYIENGQALLGSEIVETSLRIAGREIVAVGSDHGRGPFGIDARGLKVLSGIVDLHGDAFERQMMPRPGVDFPIDVALIDSDRQAISNGITTVFHATTWSWEPGLRSGDNARQLLEAIESMRPQFAADTRFHLRHETYNLDAEPEIIRWLSDGRIDLLAFNDHMDSTVAGLAKPQKRSRMVERTGLSNDAFDQLVERVVSRAHEVPASIARLAQAAREADVRMLSHDDDSPAMRAAFRSQGGGDRRISGQRGNRARGGGSRRLHRVRRAQCRARRQPYRMDQGVRHDRQGLMFGACVRLLLSRAIAGGLSADRRPRAAAR